ERFAFVVTDNHNLVAIELGETGAKRAIVPEKLVAMQLDPLVEDEIEIVGEHGAIGMASDLHRFPGIKAAVDAADRLGKLASERADLVVELRRLGLCGVERADPLFDLMDRLLEGQAVDRTCHCGWLGSESVSESVCETCSLTLFLGCFRGCRRLWFVVE